MNKNSSTNNNFIQQQIQRSDRYLFITGIILFLAPLAILGTEPRYWYNFFFGSFPMTEVKLQGIKELSKSPQYFVTVQGKKSIPLGIEATYQTKIKGIVVSSKTSRFAALQLNHKTLLIKTSPKQQRSTKQIGYLATTIPDEVRNHIVTAVGLNTFSESFFPFLLVSDESFRWSGYSGLAIALIPVTLGLKNMINVVRRGGKLELHPLNQELTKFGNPQLVAAQIDSEIATGTNNFNSGKDLIITRSWLIYKNTYSLELLHLGQILWIYPKFIEHESGISKKLIVIDRNSKTLEISSTEEEVKKYMEEIRKRIPWVICGSNDKLQTLWQLDQASFLAIFEQRRQEMEN